jgi:hypothetical protein
MTTFNDGTSVTSGSVDIPTPSVTILGYTSIGAIEALYGQNGRTNILVDLDNTIQGSDGFTEYERVIRHFIRDAEQTIISRLNGFFSPEAMIGNSWIESRATWIASHYISRRRGNEHYFFDMYEEALRELDAIGTGELPPPADIPLRAYSMPSMSNIIIDNRFGIHKIRVRPTISVGETYAGQDISYEHGHLYGWV